MSPRTHDTLACIAWAIIITAIMLAAGAKF